MTARIAAFALAGAIAVAGPPTRAADSPTTYRLTDTVTGSLVPQDIVLSTTPFDGRYDELTAQQKAALASDYESLGPGDEPPYPLYGVRHLLRPVVRYADMAAPVGPMVVSVAVDSTGKPGAISVYRSPSPEMTRLVAAALALESYKPASCHGQPCAMDYVLRLDFPQRGGQPLTASAFGRYDPNAHTIDTH